MYLDTFPLLICILILKNIFFDAGIWEYIEELREFVIDLDSRVEKAQINATHINKLMKGDAKPVFTRYDDGRPAENLFNKEGKDYSTLLFALFSFLEQVRNFHNIKFYKTSTT